MRPSFLLLPDMLDDRASTSCAAHCVRKGCMMAKADKLGQVMAKCRRLAEQMGLELVDVSLDQEGAGKYLRIYITKGDVLSLDDCEAFHRAVIPLVEDFDYDFLEVSSPGLDRPIKTDEDFRWAEGTVVEVHLFRPLEGSKRWQGTLKGLQDGAIHLQLQDRDMMIPRKSASLVKPFLDIDAILSAEPDPSEESAE